MKPHAAVCCNRCPNGHTDTCQKRERALQKERADAWAWELEQAPDDIDRGYLVLRAPPSLEHMRGLHKCSWRILWETKLSDKQTHLGNEFYICQAGTEAQNQRRWLANGLRGTPPVLPSRR